MAEDFKTPEEIAEQYLLHLKALKPEVNTDQTDTDWWIRAHVLGGVLSGIYADQRKVAEDAFPQSARREALERHLELYFGEGFIQPTQAEGELLVSGATGSLIPAGTEFQYSPNGNTYTADEDVTLDATTGVVPVTSVGTGQVQNLLEGATLQLPSAPAGVDPTATVYNGNIADGRDEETNEEAATRILDRIRNPISGGTESDYRQWAREASDSVTDSNVIRFLYGPGSVGVIVVAGTTDIDTALDNDIPIVRIPTDELIQTVSDYIEARKPLTDCAFILKPTEIDVDVTARVRYRQGDGSTIPSGQTLTQEELVIREVKRAIYKTPPGGRQFGSSGFVVVSEIEEVIDQALSAEPYTEGSIGQILVDRQIEDLSATGVNLMIAENELATPGTITVIEF